MPETDIPVPLRHRPTVGGLVVPWITVQMPDGRYRFGAIDADRLRTAFIDHLCQICGEQMSRLFVFAMRTVDFERLISTEPAMHPECARYSVTACPMIAGHMTHYRAQASDAPESAGDPHGARPGHRAHEWRLLWTTGYRTTLDPRTRTPAAEIPIELLQRVQRIRPPAPDQ
ncbi:hypothetical protein MED01_005759 [Micromonospora sp. MED01]|uniref:hypothetical protein n=1 Tax=Micromonospora alfalfae TaxID=2911212 RepID=UPI001EE92D62|nr:hypothetical protein [Micromonospora alfalfae]MCG5466717.1 hypothetical protein [Micromonospora alfalfae]